MEKIYKIVVKDAPLSKQRYALASTMVPEENPADDDFDARIKYKKRIQHAERIAFERARDIEIELTKRMDEINDIAHTFLKLKEFGADTDEKGFQRKHSHERFEAEKRLDAIVDRLEIAHRSLRGCVDVLNDIANEGGR